jgi:hypothetical protein
MASNNESRGGNPLLWLFGLLAVGGALIGVSRLPEQTPPKQAPQPAKDQTPPAVLDEGDEAKPLTVLCDYLRVESAAPRPSSPMRLRFAWESDGPSLSVSAEEQPGSRKPGKPLEDYLRTEPAEYEFLIATVPDPVESKFPHEFDAVLEGIQQAFAARDFTLRRSRMPWRHHRSQAASKSKPPNPYREYPGVLLFRKNPQPDGGKTEKSRPCIALVCLVGETPISGLHKPALTQALRARKKLNEAINKAQQGEPKGPRVRWTGPSEAIRIVAPFYTVSQTSLTHTLRQWRSGEGKGGPAVRIMNGNATGLTAKKFDDPIVSTVIPHALVTQGVLRYLIGDPGTTLDKPDREKRIGDQIAILREANTGFGESAKSIPFDGYVTYPVIDLPFPSSISQLAVVQDQNAKPLLPRTDFVEPKLPVRDLNQLDAVPPYDPDSAASTAGQRLRAIMTTITRARVRYVGIVSSDARDVVFLTRLLQKECPDARVFTAEPSSVLLHPEDAVYLRGMVVGSTYPLAPVAQYWAMTALSPTRMIPFSTQGSQGYYNAVLAQFGRPDLMLGYHPPSILGTSGDVDRPPIWISVIGNDGRLVPVHCYTNYKSCAETKSSSPQLYLAAATPEVIELHGQDDAKKVNQPAYSAMFGIPIGVLLGSFGAVVTLALVILALCVPQLWTHWAAGASASTEPSGKNTASPAASTGAAGAGEPLSTAKDKTPDGAETSPPPSGKAPVEAKAAADPASGGKAEPPPAPADANPTPVEKAKSQEQAGSPPPPAGGGTTPEAAKKPDPTPGSKPGSAPTPPATPAAATAEKEGPIPGPWVWIWRGVMLAGILCFALPYSLPIREIGHSCCGVPDGAAGWRHTTVFLLAVVVAVEVFAVAVLLWLRGFGVIPRRSEEHRSGFLVLGVVVLAIGFLTLNWWWQTEPIHRFFLYVRAMDFTSGLSPLVPMGLLGAAAFVFGYCGLRQAESERGGRLKQPYPEDRWAEIKEADAMLQGDLRSPYGWLFLPSGNSIGILCIVLTPCVLWLIWNCFVIPLPSGEGWPWDLVVRTVFWLTITAIALTLVRFLAFWWWLAKLLKEICKVPMVRAFEHLPDEVRRLSGGYSSSLERIRHTQLTVLAYALPPEEKEGDAFKREVGPGFPALDLVFGDGKGSGNEDGRELAEFFRQKAETYLKDDLKNFSKKKSVTDAFGRAEPRQPEAAGGDRKTGGEGEASETTQTAPPDPKEVFVASYVAIYLGPYFAHLRMLAHAMIWPSLLLLLAAASYPLQPERPLLNALVGLLAAVAAGTLYVLYKINRNGLVSRIARTAPERFTPDTGFFSSLLTTVFPVAAVVLLHLLGLFRVVVDPILGLFQ